MRVWLTDLLVPARCGGCLDPIPERGPRWCAACRERVDELALPDLAWTRLRPGVLAVSAFAYAGPVAAALKRAKTPGGHGLAPTLRDLLWQRLAMAPQDLPGTRTWVPSTAMRARSRAVELPRVLAGEGAVPLLARRGDPPDQASLEAHRRRLAPFGTFVARGPVPPALVLIDDVRTTGATALAATEALAEAGARRILLVTLAAGGQDPLADLSRRPSPGPAGTARSR